MPIGAKVTFKEFLFGPERRQAPSDVYPRPSIGFSTFPMMATRSQSGQTVTVDTALGLVPVYSAVELLAGAIGSLPLKVYRKGDTRTEAPGSRQWKMLHERPNEEIAADEFWEIVATNLLLWGNAFLFKQRDPLGVVTSLWPLRSSRCAVGRLDLENGKSVRYFVLDGIREPIFESDILHIRGLSPDGLVGYSPIQQARNRLGNEQSRDEFQGSFWQNFTFAGGFLKHPNRLSTEAQERLAEQVKAKAGTLRAGEFMVLEEGLDIENVTMPLEDAQFVQQANLGRLETALLYRVPPYMLGAETEGSLTYSNAEWQSLDFVKWSLRRWLVRIENSLKRDASLFPPGGPNLYPEFLVDALLRGDSKSRWETYQIMLATNVVTTEWVAETENLPEPPEAPEPPAVVAPPPDPELIDRFERSEEKRSREFQDLRALVREQQPQQMKLEIPAPIVNFNKGAFDGVATPNVTIEAPPPAQIHVDAPAITVEAPARNGKRKVEFSDGRTATIEEE